MNKYLIHWQWDDEGSESAVKLTGADTLAEAIVFVEKHANVAVIHDRSANGFPHTDTPVIRWQNPTFTGKVATSLRVLAL
jgi:hypothetical protein